MSEEQKQSRIYNILSGGSGPPTPRVFILILLLGLAFGGTQLRAQNAFAYTATGTCSCEGGGSLPGSVSAYQINSTNGALTQVNGSPFPAGRNSQSLAVDPTRQFLYVANHDSNDLSVYVINPASGLLTPIPNSPFAAGRVRTE